MLLKAFDLDKNSVISKTTNGNCFKKAKVNQIKLYDPKNSAITKQLNKMPTQKELLEETYFETLEKII